MADAQLASLADETPEGRYCDSGQGEYPGRDGKAQHDFVGFVNHMSGINYNVIERGRRHKVCDGKAASISDIMLKMLQPGQYAPVVAKNGQVLGVVHLKDIIKTALRNGLMI